MSSVKRLLSRSKQKRRTGGELTRAEALATANYLRQQVIQLEQELYYSRVGFMKLAGIYQVELAEARTLGEFRRTFDDLFTAIHNEKNDPVGLLERWLEERNIEIVGA